MLVRDFSPKTFSDLRGLDFVKKVLSAVVKSPKTAPRSFIFSGSFGLGKTSCARIFARALNCKEGKGEACNNCENCNENFSVFYQEYDSAIAGNVEVMRSLRETFAYSFSLGYKVVTFDESHLVSKQAQAVLLKAIEEAPTNIFFIFPTTEASHLLDTIRSRSLVLEFELLLPKELEELVKKVLEKKNISMSEEVLSILIRRSGGHARDALQLVDLYLLLGEEGFIERSKGTDMLFEEFINKAIAEDFKSCRDIILKILQKPLVYVKQDFEVFMKLGLDRIYIKQEDLKELKNIILFYLKFQSYLKSTNDWYLFFMYIIDFFKKEKKELGDMRNRFRK